jgi:hypothetical protein
MDRVNEQVMALLSADPVAIGNVGISSQGIALPISLGRSSASELQTMKTDQELQAIAGRPNNAAPGQIVCVDNGGATMRLGSLG